MTKPLPLRSLLAVGASVAALSALAHPALAQTSSNRTPVAGATPGAAQGSNTIEELVVTAEKREQSLQQVPVAVTAYTSERRTILGANTVEDIARLTPSLSYTNNDRLSIRGMGRLTNSIGTDPSVALYSDGIFSNSMADASTPPLFIERTEILRGPQGTLYGRNSIGGTLNIISKRPTEDFNGEVRAYGGNYGSWRTDAMIRGPITDHLRFLLGGSLERRDKGFIENIGPGGDTAAVKRSMIEAQVEADLGEHIVARMRFSKFDWDDSYGVGNTLFQVISPLDTTSLTGVGTQALYYNPTYGYTGVNAATADPYKTNTNDTATGKLSDHYRFQTDVTWDLGGATLKYLGGFQTYIYDTTGDLDQTPRTAPQDILVPTSPVGPFTARNVSTDSRTFYQERQKWFSNEVDLSSSNDGPLQWIVGLYEYHQRYDQPQGIRVVGDPGIYNPLTLQGTLSDPNPRGAYLYVDGHLETNSYAGFGQIDWKFAPTLTLTAGLRYTYDEKKGYDIARYVARLPSLAVALAAGTPAPLLAINATQAYSVDITTLQVCGGTTLASCALNPATANLFANPGGGLRRNLSGNWDALTGTLSLKWEPDPDTNLYARYSRGYKSGGWLGSNGLSPDPYADPEHVNAYEVGLKKNIGRRFQANASLFYDDYNGFQTPLTVPLGTITATQFLNLNARIWGFELETQWAPVDHLQVYGSYAYLNTKIQSGCCFIDTADPTARAAGARPSGTAVAAGQPQSLVGNPLPLSPKNKFTLGANYTFEFGSDQRLIINGTVTHTDSQQSTIFRDPIYTSPSNNIADFTATWRTGYQGLTVVGYLKNAFDEVAYQSSTANPAGVTAVGPRRQVILNYPRTYGVELQYKF